MALTNLDPTALNTRYYSFFVTDSQPSSNQADYLANIEQAAAIYSESQKQSPIETPDTKDTDVGKFTDLNRQIATICTVCVIGFISTAVFGLAGGIPLTLASAFITTKLLAILLVT